MNLSKLITVSTAEVQKFSHTEKKQARDNINAMAKDEFVSQINIGYKELVNLRNSGNLIPGMRYRITDYVTTTSASSSRSAGYPFDIIVTATSNNSFSEDASAVHHRYDSISSLESVTLPTLIVGNINPRTDELELDDDHVWVYFDQCNINNVMYVRWVRYREYGDMMLPDSSNGNHSPEFALTRSENIDLSDGPVPFEGYIVIDEETGNVDSYSNNDYIMEIENREYPLMLFENEFQNDETAPAVIDSTGGYDYTWEMWIYKGTIQVGDDTYYKWQHWDQSMNPYVWDDEDDDYYVYMLTDTKDFANGVKSSPAGFLFPAIMGDELYSLSGKDVKIVATNYSKKLEEIKSMDRDYFEGADLDAWKIKYTIDNDKEVYDWAVPDVQETEQISMKVKTVGDVVNFYWYMRYPEYDNETDGYAWVYLTAGDGCDWEEISDYTDIDYGDIIWTSGNTVQEDDEYNMGDEPVIVVSVYSETKIISNGRGVIYYMKDEWGNECPYDFKSIQFRRQVSSGTYTGSGDYTWVYTFTAYDITADTYLDSWKAHAINPTIKIGAYGNVIKPYITTIGRMGTVLKNNLNDIVFLNKFSEVGEPAFLCYNNIFEYGCHNITFGDSCYDNYFADGCFSNTFGSNIIRNHIGNEFFGNTVGDNFENNTLGCYVYTNNFGNKCTDNIFGNHCMRITLGNECINNTFGNSCNNIKLASNASGSAGTYFKGIHIDSDVKFVILYASDDTVYAQYYHIKSPVSGTSAAQLQIPLTRGNNYETTIAYDTSGQLQSIYQ